MAREQGHHQHEALKHRHKHYHVTHYLHRGENWDTCYPLTLTSTIIRHWSMCTSRTGTWRRSTGERHTSMTTHVPLSLRGKFEWVMLGEQ